VLAGSDLETQLANMGASLESSAGAGLRIGLTSAPAANDGEVAFSLPTATRPGWLYGQPSVGWDRESLERIGPAVARLIDVAVERDRLGARSAEAEATRRADVAKTALLHAISHDFRSPLTAIATAAGGLRTGELGSEDRDALLSVIEGETQRLARLVEDLLDVSRIEAGAVNPRPDWCDLHDLVANAAAQVRDRQGDHPVQLDLPGDLPLVRADAAQLERVFSNLLDNAIKFSPDGAPVQVSGGAGAGRVTVRVTDQGRGIPPSKRAQVFEPFFRGRDSGQGSGLGLAICRGLVEANGGEIRLQGDAPHGTTFAVSFPLVRQPLGAEEATR
jgi:two-component system sensor histidine kinase KdpD